MNRKNINEALGVPENIINSAIKLYDYFLAYVYSLKNIESEESYQTEMIGNFRISDMTLSKINLKLDLPKSSINNFVLLGMGQASENKINSLFQMEAVLVKDVVDLSVDIVTPNKFDDNQLIEFIKDNKNILIPIFAHELKHGYDIYKKNTYNLYSKVEYNVFSSANFGAIKPLGEFLFNSYYIHNIENLVRPTEMAAEIVVKKITPSEFKSFFIESKIYKTLKNIKEFSLDKLKNDLGSYINEIDDLLNHVGENYNTDDEKIDRILELFYFNLTNWKNDKIINYLYPFGMNNPLFLIFRSPERDNYLDYFMKKSGKYADNYLYFFKYEENFQRTMATKMIKKLGRLYELTNQNVISENKSIWDWELYHKIYNTSNEITNKIKSKDELLSERPRK